MYHAGLIFYKLGAPAKAESLWQMVLKIDEIHTGAKNALQQLINKKTF